MAGSTARRFPGSVGPLLMLAALWVSACASGGRLPHLGGATVTEVTLEVVRPAPVDLADRGIEILGVSAFQGPAGPEFADRLAEQLGERGPFRVLGPGEMRERLTKAGLDVEWDSSPSVLGWVEERTGVEGVVVGRVEVFRVEDREREKETVTLEPSGEYVFVLTPEGKLSYQEEMVLREVPMFCRSDHGTVEASYRVWDTRRGEEVATVRHHLSTEIASFCHRGEAPEELVKKAQERLLKALFRDLNEQFLDDVIPQTVETRLRFEVLDSGDGAAIERNELGILYASRGQWKRAVEMWQDCLLAHPDLPAAHYNLALAYRATGRTSLAREHLRKALNVTPKPLYRETLREVLAAEEP